MSEQQSSRPGRMNAPTEANVVDLIARYAAIGKDDPTIAGLLGLQPSTVARLRKKHGIEPGYRRHSRR